MVNWPLTNSIKQLRGLLGLTRFYRSSINNYASIAYALTKLFKKDSFAWNSDAQLAFGTLKTAMTEAAVLQL